MVSLPPVGILNSLSVINASEAVTLLEQRPRKKFQVLSGIRIRTHDLCDAGAVLSQLSYQSHMRAVVKFSDLCSSSVTAALALMTVITQLLLWDKLLSTVSRVCRIMPA